MTRKYTEIHIYFFSGTGNSKNVALWIKSLAEKNDIECKITNIADIDRLIIEAPPNDALVVYISPIHGFNYPPVMLNFLARFPKGKNKVLLMNTRAGMLIGKWITPGLTGIAFYLSGLLLKIKGYSITGMIPVDLPSNWISVHPGLNERTVKFLHEKNKERVTSNVEKVLSGKNNFKGAKEIFQDILISPIAVLYYFIGRFFLAKTYYASGECDNCDACIKACPVKAIKKVNNRPFWTFNCESCMHCMSYCPKKAIETGHGYTIGFLVLNSSVLTVLFHKYYYELFGMIENNFARSILETLIFIFSFGVFYRLLHYLRSFKIIDRMIVYTSLTKYKFWGRRYKAIKDI